MKYNTFVKGDGMNAETKLRLRGDMKTDLQALANDRTEGDLSMLVRQILREYLDTKSIK